MWKKVKNGQGSEIQYLPEVGRWEDKPGLGLIICDDSGNKADLDLGPWPDSLLLLASQLVFRNHRTRGPPGESGQIQATGTQAHRMWLFQ